MLKNNIIITIYFEVLIISTLKNIVDFIIFLSLLHIDLNNCLFKNSIHFLNLELIVVSMN